MLHSITVRLRYTCTYPSKPITDNLIPARHAQKYFFPLHDDKLSELQNVMGMLAFPVDTDQQPYKVVLRNSRTTLGIINK